MMKMVKIYNAENVVEAEAIVSLVYCIIKIPKVADKNGESCISILEKIA